MRTTTLVLLVSLSCFALADNKGTCPATPPPSEGTTTTDRPVPPSADMQYAGNVLVLTVLSDAGEVCSAQLLRGFNPDADKTAIAKIKDSHFEPARTNGVPVPVTVTVEVIFWRDANGKFVTSIAQQKKQAESPASSMNPQTKTATKPK
jgi:hypothetical protein